MHDEQTKQMLKKIEEICNFIRENSENPLEVKTASDDLLSVLRYERNVLGGKYGKP